LCSPAFYPTARYPLASIQPHRRKILSVLTALKSFIKRLPIIEEIVSERDTLRREIKEVISEQDKLIGFVPPGHFYSPVPSFFGGDKER